MSRTRGVEVYPGIIKLDPSAPYFVQSRTLGSLRGHRHSKALTVPYSADNRTETSPEASSAPLPARDVAYEGSRDLFCHHKLDSSAPYFVQSRTLAPAERRGSSIMPNMNPTVANG